MRLQLFCLPFAGGGAGFYRTWAQGLSSDIQVIALQLPGRESRFSEPAYTRMPELIESLTQAIIGYIELPFAIFGHSMGALIGFELTRNLGKNSLPQPVHLFVSGQRAPQLPNPHKLKYALPDNKLLEELRRYDGTPREVLDNSEMMEIMMPTLRADFELNETYDYSHAEPLSINITALGGKEDWQTTPAELAGWESQTKSSFDLHMFPGGHFYLRDYQEDVHKLINQALPHSSS